MGMSARVLGREFFNRTAQEMNKLLLAHGFLEGGPGAYRPTALGEQFAKWVDKDNGYGGSAARAWSFLTWDDRVVDALKASIKANPNGVAPPAAPPEVVVSTVKAGAEALRTGGGANGQLLSRNAWVAAGVVVAGLGVSSPAARRIWDEKVKPAASRARARIVGPEPIQSNGDKGGEDDPWSGPGEPPHPPES